MLVGIALLLPLLGAASAAGSPIQDKQAEATRIQRQLDAQGERISQLDEQYNRAQLNVSSTQASLAKAQADLAAANQRFGQVRGHMSSAAVNAYMHGGNTSMVEQLVKSNGKDLLVRKQYVETAAADQRSALDELKAARQDLEANRPACPPEFRRCQDCRRQTDGPSGAIDQAVAAQQATLSKVKGDLGQLIARDQAHRAADAARRAQADLTKRQADSAKPSRGPAGKSIPAGPPPPVGHGAAAAVATARAQIGKPYVYGASTNVAIEAVIVGFVRPGRTLPAHRSARSQPQTGRCRR